MTSSSRSALAASPPPPAYHPPVDNGEGVSQAEAARLLECLDDIAQDMDRLAAKRVAVVEQLGSSGHVEALTGLTMELTLKLRHKSTKQDAWMWQTAAQVLAHMPVTRTLFAEGTISWAQTRRIVGRARHLRNEQRTQLDERVRASLDMVDRFDPDGLVDAVEQAADDIDGSEKAERDEDRASRDDFLYVQQGLWGGVRLYGEYHDPLAGATVVNAIDDASGLPSANSEDPGEPSTRSKQRAKGLVRLAEAWLAGGNDKKAKPLVTVGVDIRDVTPTASGFVEVNAPGFLPTITARLTDLLAKDADMRAVLFEGKTPLAASKKVCADDIPADTRVAVRLRDRGCRMPGSRAPIGHTDAHHPRGRHNGHHPDDIAHVTRRFHTILHDHGWTQRIDPEDGAFIIERNGDTYTSLPRGTKLKPPRPKVPPDVPPPDVEDRGPPVLSSPNGPDP